MHLKTILNRIQRFKSFVYGRVVLVDNMPGGPELHVDVHERAGSRGVCGSCGKRRAGYDRQPMRRYEFVPLWGIRVFFCSDRWKPYLQVVAEKAGGAIHVLDRFHIVAHINKAIDEVRAAEHKEQKLAGNGELLKNLRYAFLKNPENLTDKQVFRMADILKIDLKSVKSWLLRENFQRFWEYTSPYHAGRFLDGWCDMTMRIRIEPMKRVARMLHRHRELMLNWHRAKGQLSSGVVEGFNNRAKLTTRKAYGFRTYHGEKKALYHALGDLPTPKAAHVYF